MWKSDSAILRARENCALKEFLWKILIMKTIQSRTPLKSCEKRCNKRRRSWRNSRSRWQRKRTLYCKILAIRIKLVEMEHFHWPRSSKPRRKVSVKKSKNAATKKIRNERNSSTGTWSNVTYSSIKKILQLTKQTIRLGRPAEWPSGFKSPKCGTLWWVSGRHLRNVRTEMTCI